eukprot:6200317-Pleurochrysis_carterae.AAC.1
MRDPAGACVHPRRCCTATESSAPLVLRRRLTLTPSRSCCSSEFQLRKLATSLICPSHPPSHRATLALPLTDSAFHRECSGPSEQALVVQRQRLQELAQRRDDHAQGRHGAPVRLVHVHVDRGVRKRPARLVLRLHRVVDQAERERGSAPLRRARDSVATLWPGRGLPRAPGRGLRGAAEQALRARDQLVAARRRHGHCYAEPQRERRVDRARRQRPRIHGRRTAQQGRRWHAHRGGQAHAHDEGSYLHRAQARVPTQTRLMATSALASAFSEVSNGANGQGHSVCSVSLCNVPFCVLLLIPSAKNGHLKVSHASAAPPSALWRPSLERPGSQH